MKKVKLKHKRTAAVKRFHPWVFSGAIYSVEEGIEDGEVIEVYDANEGYLATGHYQHEGSISVRIFSFERTDARQDFWESKIGEAFAYRKSTGIIGHSSISCYRLMHAEGDGTPGLIIDIYGDTAVVQCHSAGMHQALEYIVPALQKLYGDSLVAIYDKSRETLPKRYAGQVKNQYLLGKGEGASVVKEYDHKFSIDWENGQKTGFFIDQRENRQLLSAFCKDKIVLNAFSYSGGFSVYALKAGAKRVDSVDVSKTAIELTDKNIALNGFGADQHQSYTEDVMDFLKTASENYDVMVVDPPAFAKNLRKRHNAVQGYKRLNVLALKKIKPGGVLFTFSCSQVVGSQLFYDTIVAAALEAGRKIRVMYRLSQPTDHPVNIYHPEGEYLKGLVVYVL